MSETTAVSVPQEQDTQTALTKVPTTGVADIWLDKERFDQAVRVASAFSRTDIVPQNYQNKPENCLIALDVAARMGMSPLTVMQSLYVVKGKPTWSGQACMSMIQGCGKFTDVRLVYTGTKGTENRGCYVEATRISDGEIVEGTEVTLAMARAEGWTSNSKWKNMPEQMLGYRAAAFFARLHCPDALMGFQTAEEAEDVSGNTKPKSTAQRLAAALKVDVTPAVVEQTNSVADALRAE